MRKRMKTLLIFVTMFWLSFSVLSADVVLTFDPPGLPHGARYVNSHIESGVVFTSVDSYPFEETDTGVSGRADDGSAHLDIMRVGDQFKFQDNRLFRLYQFDVAEYSVGFCPATIQIAGYKSDNSFVTFVFTTDGIFDATGPLADFQTVTLPDTFTDLQRVQFNSAIFSIDNVSITIVPEPSTAGYVLLSALSLVLRRHRRKA